MKLAISNLAWEHKDDQKIVPLLKKHNVSAIEVAPSKVWHNPTSATKKEILKYRKFWENYGLKIIATTSVLYGHPELTIFESKKKRTNTLDYIRLIIELSSSLGAKAIVFGSPKNRVTGNLSKSNVQKIAQDFFYQIGEICKPHKLFFGIEPNPPIYNTDFINTTQEALKLVKAVNHSNFKVHLDSGALFYENKNTLETLSQAIPLSSHFHISELFLKTIPQKKAPHQALAKTLSKLNYQGYLSIEMPLPPNEDHFSQITKTLKFIETTYQT